MLLSPRRRTILRISGIILGSLVSLVLLWRLALALSPSLRARAQYWNARLTVYFVKRAAVQEQARIAADTVGGKTPEETLQLYTQALERNDWRAASRLIIEEKRQAGYDELRALREQQNLGWYLNLLKAMQPDGVVEGNFFRMKAATELGPDYFIRFRKYPAGNWKLLEI